MGTVAHLLSLRKIQPFFLRDLDRLYCLRTVIVAYLVPEVTKRPLTYVCKLVYRKYAVTILFATSLWNVL